MRERNMKNKNLPMDDELRPEYNFDYSKAVTGKYFRRPRDEGSNIVILEPDVAEMFRDSASVNKALRSLLKMTASTQKLTGRLTTSSRKQSQDIP
jgi:hypothetical protein